MGPLIGEEMKRAVFLKSICCISSRRCRDCCAEETGEAGTLVIKKSVEGIGETKSMMGQGWRSIY